MEEFIEQEDEEIVLKLRDELLYMKKKDAWEEACVLAARQGNRMWSLEETKDHLTTFLVLLQKEKRRDLLTPFSFFEMCSFNGVLLFWSTFIYAF
ncbi:hypothetical protein BAHan_0714 [Bacillus anthracis]|nr:hypothetical protein BAHan_0714 [Bacillus anthracis]